MRASSLALLGLIACAPDFVEPRTDEGLDLVTIHGQVLDSLTRGPVVGVSVAIEGKFFYTDATGRFTAQVLPGINDIHVAAASFEPSVLRVNVSPQDQFLLQLRRLAPIPQGCQIGPDGFAALVIDLQGRKSLERWSRSRLTLVTPAARRTIGALDWDYLPLDTYQWQVSIPDADPALTLVEWELYDNEGNAYRGSCEPLPVVPPDPDGT